MFASSELKHRLMIAAMPLAMVLLWLGMVARGSGGLDALGNPVGGDFAMFYIAGHMAANGEWHSLYDEAQQQQRLIELFPGLPVDTYLPYRYPPLLAMILSPLGRMPYPAAQLTWSLMSLALWLASWLALSRTFLPRSSPLARTCLIGLVASPIMAQTLIDGQASFGWFAILTFTWLLIHQRRFALAGVCLALAACKPNVLLLMSVVWVVRYPRLLVGLIPTGLAMFIATLSIAGRDCLATYIELGSQLATQSWSVETPYWKVQSLLSWTQLPFGSAARPINLFVGLATAVALGWFWRQSDQRSSQETERLRCTCCALSLGLLTNALFNPYTPIYDLMLLSLGMFAWLVYAERTHALAAWLQHREVKLMIACLWLGPILSQCLSRELACPQQWMPLILLIVLFSVMLRGIEPINAWNVRARRSQVVA